MKFGKTWWGEKWLDALDGIYYENRIPRGRSYANTGKVYNIKFNNNLVTARVEGNYSPYYRVSIIFEPFNNLEKKKIAEIINNSPLILSALLNNQLPVELYDKLKKEKIKVFPTSWHDFNSSCNCFDYAIICKHIAGLVYMIAHEIDKDPFLVFKLHDCDLYELLDYDKKKSKIPTVNKLLSKKEEIKFKELDYSKLNFSEIPDLLDKIFLLLDNDPVFYEKDFKEILRKSYKSFRRYYNRTNKTYYNNDYNSALLFNTDFREFNEKKEEFDKWKEEYFAYKWFDIHKSSEFSINIDGKYDISKITLDTPKNPFVESHLNISKFQKKYHEYSKNNLFYAFLHELNDNVDSAYLINYNYNIQFLNILYQFTGELIKKYAIIPEIFKIKTETFAIRWIPAIFDKKIKYLLEQLYSACPSNLLTFKNKNISRKQQVLTVISLIIKGYMQDYLKYGLSQAMKKQRVNPVFELFFNKPQIFKKSKYFNLEDSIHQWLSKFTLKSRNYELFLIISENTNMFSIDIKVSVNSKTPENIMEVIKTTENKNLKLDLLQDSYLINELLPDINKINEDIEYASDDFLEFFNETLPLFEMTGISIILPKSLQKIIKPKIVLDMKKSLGNEASYLKFKDLTNYDWKIAVGDERFSEAEFEQLVKNNKGLVKIANNYVILDKKDVESLIKKMNKLPANLKEPALMQALLSKQIDNIDVELDYDLDKLAKDIKTYGSIEVPDSLNATLRDYQKTGYSWLLQNIKTGFGSILADDMGLGKTIQVLSVILYLKENQMLNKEKVLIIAPTSLLTNWQNEIRKFTPALTSYIYHGSNRKFPKREYDIYLTSYGVLRQDKNKIKKRKWFLMVVDEAQNIKNPLAMQTKSIKSIKSEHKIALSGTPVENRLSEYWSIFDFVNKNYLGTIKKFRKNYILPIEKERNTTILENFKLITSPFILRRLKTDKNIIKDLPDKVINDTYCNLTKKQSAIYQEILNDIMNTIKNKEGINRKGMIFKLINSLKQICNHPSQFTKNKTRLIQDSGKMEMLINILDNIIASNEKVLIFTQYVEMGEIIQEILEEKYNMEILFLNGKLTRNKRDQMVSKFQNNSQNKIFIISLKAGGTGLNLTAAQNVIHYDLWWNPAVEEQATDRAYRIGQKENVMVYRFITSGTFEEKINEMIQKKKELAEMAVGSEEQFITEMSDEQLRDMFNLRD